MVQSQIVCFVVVFGLFQQTFANSASAAISTQRKLGFDKKSIQQSNVRFCARANTSNCKCPDNVDLNENNPNGKIEYNTLDSESSFACCKKCVSVISAPLGYQVEITEAYVQFRNDPNASLTIRNGNENGGCILGKLYKKNDNFRFIISAANAMTVTFSTGNTASTCQKVSYSVIVTLQKLSKTSPTLHSLSSEQPFDLIRKEDLNSSDPYWTVTAETGKQVHLYLYGYMSESDGVKMSIIDGTDVNGKLISQVTQLSYVSTCSWNAISSSGGSLTVLLAGFPHNFLTDINLLFTQLENDPTECGTSELVFVPSYSCPEVNVQISSHGAAAASCPAVLITNSQFADYPGIQLNISSLQGSMVLYEGVDSRPSSNNEIIRFSSMNDVISPMQIAGGVFLVQLNPESAINLSFHTLPYLPKTSPTLYSLSSDQPFHLIMDKDLNSSDPYWTVTAETGKQVHLYLYGYMPNDYRKFFIFDGTDVNGKLISQLTEMSSSLNGPLKAISSSGGSLTVLLDCKQFSYLDEANFLFTQLENDPSECGTSKLVFQLSESSPATNVQINHHGGGAASCPAVLITNPQYLSYRGMQLNVSSLQGSMILYGGVDYRPSSNNEIIRFSSYFGMNDVISPMRIPGGVFLVLSTPGSEINLDFQRTDFFSFTSATGGSGAKGLVTSDKFPIPNTDSIYNEFSFNGSGNDSYKYAINVLRYDLGGTGSLTIKSADPNSFFFSDFSKTLTSNGVNTLVQFCANSFEVDYRSNGVGQKGFVLRYDVGKTCSRGLSTALICIIAVAAATFVIAVAAFLFKRCKLRSQRNNANSTVQPAHSVRSQPNEGDPPPSYEEAVKYDALTALSHSNRSEDAMIVRV